MPEVEYVGESALGPVTITRPDPDTFTFIKARNHAQRDTRSCVRCNLHNECRGPVPPEFNRYRPDVLVVGEAPGQKEDTKGTPFTGKNGAWFRTKMERQGFNPESMAYTNAVSCWPSKTHSYGGRIKRKTRQPDKAELSACRRNLFNTLHASQCRYVLLVGATALRTFRPDLRLNRTHGNIFVWEASWFVLPTYHPAGALGKHATNTSSDAIHDDLSLLRLLVKGELDPRNFISEFCNLCGEEAVKYDPNMVGYCKEHWHGNESNWHASTYDGWRSWYQASNKKDRRRRSKAGAAITIPLFDD